MEQLMDGKETKAHAKLAKLVRDTNAKRDEGEPDVVFTKEEAAGLVAYALGRVIRVAPRKEQER
jgi:orotate phosphoribosyltransferase